MHQIFLKQPDNFCCKFRPLNYLLVLCFCCHCAFYILLCFWGGAAVHIERQEYTQLRIHTKLFLSYKSRRYVITLLDLCFLTCRDINS